jgi:hypothetical protein
MKAILPVSNALVGVMSGSFMAGEWNRAGLKSTVRVEGAPGKWACLLGQRTKHRGNAKDDSMAKKTVVGKTFVLSQL